MIEIAAYIGLGFIVGAVVIFLMLRNAVGKMPW